MASVGGIKAGKAFVLIEAVDKTAAGLRAIENKLNGWASRLQNLGSRLFGAGAAGLLPMGLSVKQFANFDDVMRQVEARSEGTAGEMAALRDQARKLGQATAFSAAQIGSLQNALAQKGFNRGQIGQMTPAILDLARVGGEGNLDEDAARSATLLSGTLRAFNMDASKTVQVADHLTTALNASNFTMEGLETSLSYAAPVAHSFNVSLEETLATLGGMVDLNLDPSTAGTAFRNMLLYMSKTKDTEDFNAKLESMGGSAVKFRDDMGNLRPLPDLLFEIGEATKTLGTAERGDLLADLFGVRAIVPALAAMGNKNPFDKMMKELANNSGASRKAAAHMDAGVGGSLRRMWSATLELALVLGETLAPAFEGIEKVVKAALAFFGEWVKNNKDMVVAFVIGAATLMAFGAALVGVSFALKVVATLVAIINGPLGLLGKVLIFTGRAGFILAGIFKSLTLVVVGFIQRAVFPLVVALAKATLAVVIFGAKTLYTFTTVLVTKVIPAIFYFAYTISMVTLAALIELTAALWAAMSPMMGFFTAIAAGAAVGAILFMVIDSLRRAYSGQATAAEDMAEATTSATSSISDAVSGMAGAIGDYLGNVWTEVGNLFGETVAFIKERFMGLWEVVSMGSRGIHAALSLGDTQAAWDVATEAMGLGWLHVVDMMADGWGSFAGAMVEAWHGAMGEIEQAFIATQKKLANWMLEVASEDSMLGKAMSAVLGVDMAAEKKRGEELEAKRKAISERMGVEYKAQDPLAEAKAGMNKDFDQKAANATAARAKAMEDFKKAQEEANAGRDEEIRKKKEALQATVDELEARAKAKSEEDPFGRKEYEDRFNQAAEGMGGAKSMAGGPATKLSEGLEKGTVEAAKQSYENKEGSKAIELAQKQADELKRIREKLEEEETV